jgi:hypothetical protein
VALLDADERKSMIIESRRRHHLPVGLLLCLSGAIGCGEEGAPFPGEEGAPSPDQVAVITQAATVSSRFATLTDGSGKITVETYQCNNDTPGAHPVVACSVPSDFVLIGGSAATDLRTPLAFLTASYPNAGLTTWTGASKDHGISHPHTLWVFATGMKVAGMTPAALRQQLSLVTRTSPVAAHPSLVASPVPANKFLLSTGASDNYPGPGNLLTAVWNTGVRGKDHEYADPATITSYELFINKTLPVGTLDLRFSSTAGPMVNTDISSANVRPDVGNYVPAGAFCFSVYDNPGRLILSYGFTPGRAASNGYECWTKDHISPARGQALAGMTFLKLVQ